MKKNQNGWGLTMMIVFMSILLGFLLLVTILIYNLYHNDQPLNDFTKEEYVHEKE